MTKTLKVALAGAGAFGLRHLDAIKLIGGVEVISVVGRELDKTTEAAAKYSVGHATTDLAEALRQRGLDGSHPGHADADACRGGASVPQGRPPSARAASPTPASRRSCRAPRCLTNSSDAWGEGQVRLWTRSPIASAAVNDRGYNGRFPAT
jgi:hypothetical protein